MDKTKLAAMTFRSFDSMSGILGWILGIVRQEFPGFNLAQKKVLEIGTGQFLNHPFGMYICGADKIVTVDVKNNLGPYLDPLENSVLARRFLSQFATNDDFDKRMDDIKKTSPKKLGIEYYAEAWPELKDFDFVMSYTTLEHILAEHIPETLKTVYRALKPGGICAHFVDLEDHRDPQNAPFAFYEDEFCGTENRIRFAEWRTLFEKCNMFVRYPYVAKRNGFMGNIHPSIRYVSHNDLKTTAFLMVGEK